MQKRAIRILYGVPARHSCVTLFTNLGVLTMPSIYIYECAMFVKKNPMLFKRNCDTHSYPTRNSNMLCVFQHSKSCFEKSPVYRLVHIFNKLPNNIKNIESIPLFKKKLFRFLLQLNLYRVSDFQWSVLNWLFYYAIYIFLCISFDLFCVIYVWPKNQ